MACQRIGTHTPELTYWRRRRTVLAKQVASLEAKDLPVHDALRDELAAAEARVAEFEGRR